MKLNQCARIFCVVVVCVAMLASNAQARSFNDEMAKKFVKLLLLGALLSPPGIGIAPVPLPLPIPVRINVNHEPIIGPPIPHPFLTGGFAGHHLGGIGAFGHGGYGKKR